MKASVEPKKIRYIKIEIWRINEHYLILPKNADILQTCVSFLGQRYSSIVVGMPLKISDYLLELIDIRINRPIKRFVICELVEEEWVPLTHSDLGIPTLL